MNVPRALRALRVPLAVAACAWGAALAYAAPEERAATAVLRVGPHGEYPRIRDAARAAPDGALVLIEPGLYAGDVASWPQRRLILRAERCCARVTASGASAEGKAIWVIKGDDVRVENIVFEGARVADRNGAGIRMEGGGRLTIRNCRFTGNELGILTSDDPRAELVVERSEFDHNRVAGRAFTFPPGHQIYVGPIARFTLRESYVHDGFDGHLVKSRARENVIEYNRIADPPGGRASYELEFPNGGLAYVVGNVIGQSANSRNPTIVSFGAEGLRWPRNALYLVNNTLVDALGETRRLVAVRAGATHTVSVNNLLVARRAPRGSSAMRRGLTWASPADVPGAAQGDYHLAARSPLVGTATAPPVVDGAPLRPLREYVESRDSAPVPLEPYSPGAFQTVRPPP
jgi:hypothetical protein